MGRVGLVGQVGGNRHEILGEVFPYLAHLTYLTHQTRPYKRKGEAQKRLPFDSAQCRSYWSGMPPSMSAIAAVS